MKISIQNALSKYEQILRNLLICSHLLKQIVIGQTWYFGSVDSWSNSTNSQGLLGAKIKSIFDTTLDCEHML